MKARDIMTRDPEVINEDRSILDAVNKMKNEECGILPIGEKENIQGVLTDRDIVIRAVAENKDLNETKISEIMTNDVIYCEEEDSLEQAVSKMNEARVRRLLVKNKDQQLTGILSLGDIIRRVQDEELLAGVFKETDIA